MSITININQLLSFYDERPKRGSDKGSVVSAITGLIGEDLILGILKHFLKIRYNLEDALKKPIGCGNRSQLDAWLIKGNVRYQVEIKNWSASSKYTYNAPANVESSFLNEIRSRNRINYLETTQQNIAQEIWKVLQNMQVPKEYEKYKPKALLAFWFPVKPATIDNPFRKCKVSEFREAIELAGFNGGKIAFDDIWIFSASLYLRQLRRKTNRIKLEMPRAKHRIDYIHQLLPGVLSKASRSK